MMASAGKSLKKQLPASAPVAVECLSLGGISLMEHLIGYPNAILIDAFALEEPVGSVLVLKLSDLPSYSAFHTTSSHDTSLQNAIELGKSLGASLPDNIMVVGIATKHVFDFSEELSPPVAEAVPQAAHIVLDLLKQTVS
jgi:hydrogenase maturation protease